MAEAIAALEVRALHKRHSGGKRAPAGVDLEIGHGERLLPQLRAQSDVSGVMEVPGLGKRSIAVVLAWLWFASAFAALLVGAASAEAAERWAAPGGTGPAATCPEADPCSLEDAVEDPSVADGDFVGLAPGDYVLGDTLTVDDNIYLSGSGTTIGVFGDGFEGARITSSADPALFVVPTEAVVQDLEIVKTGAGGRGLLVVNGLVERVKVSAPQAVACEIGSVDQGNATLVNAACLGGETAVLTSVEAPGNEFAVIDAVTALSTDGPAVVARGAGPGAQARIDMINTIAQGIGGDVRAETDGSGGASATVKPRSSAYVNAVEAGASTSVTPAGTAGNPAIRAAFLDAAAGDVRQRPRSATINRGQATLRLGFSDFEGDKRLQGGSYDIGADEAPTRRGLFFFVPRNGSALAIRKRLRLTGDCDPTSCVVKGNYRIKLNGRRKPRRGLFPERALSRRERFDYSVRLSPKLKRKLRRRGGRLVVRLRADDPTGVFKKIKRSYPLVKRL